MNVAMDLVINDALVESKDNAGNKLFKMPQVGVHDPKLATGMDSVIDAYKKVYKHAKGKGGGQGQGQGNPGAGKGFDQHLTPGTSQGKDATQAAQDRSNVDWPGAVAAAA